MTFELFTPLFDKIDKVTTTFVTDISSKVIVAITPIVSVGLTLSFIIYGMLIIRGAINMPVMEFLKKAIQISIITTLALSTGLYQQHIAEVIRATPDELVTGLIPSSSRGTEASAAAIIDQTAATSFAKAGKAFSCAGFFGSEGLTYGLFGIIITITTGIFLAIGGATLLLTKIYLAILAGLGPLFIVSLLWQPTVKFFDVWIAQVMNYILLIVLFSAVFGLSISIYGSYMEDMEFDGITNVAQGLGGMVILSIAMIVILLQLPRLASSLAGGISLSYLHELSSIKRGVVSAYSVAASGITAGAWVYRKIAVSSSGKSKGSDAHSSDGGGSGADKNRAPYGYFRGKS